MLRAAPFLPPARTCASMHARYSARTAAQHARIHDGPLFPRCGISRSPAPRAAALRRGAYAHGRREALAAAPSTWAGSHSCRCGARRAAQWPCERRPRRQSRARLPASCRRGTHRPTTSCAAPLRGPGTPGPWRAPPDPSAARARPSSAEARTEAGGGTWGEAHAAHVAHAHQLSLAAAASHCPPPAAFPRPMVGLSCEGSLRQLVLEVRRQLSELVRLLQLYFFEDLDITRFRYDVSGT